MHRPPGWISAVVTAIVVASGCSSAPPRHTAVTYTPAAYGADGQCYWIYSPDEAASLTATGLCPAGWRPQPMPPLWEDEYFDYYDSDAYVLAYVAVGNRGAYRVKVSAYGSANRAAIALRSKTAAYVGSDHTRRTGPAGLAFGSGSGPGMSPRPATPATRPAGPGAGRTAPRRVVVPRPVRGAR